MERGLSFKGKKTFYLNTWHGTPIKKMGSDIDSSNKSFGTKGRSRVDVMLAQGHYEAEIFSRVFNIPFENFRIIGLPRNDELVKNNISKQMELKKQLNISLDKKVILYAPTFREFTKDSAHNCIFAPPIDLKRFI